MHNTHRAVSTSRRHLCTSGQEARFPPTDTSDTDKNPAGGVTNRNCVSQGCRRRRKSEDDLETTGVACLAQTHGRTLIAPTTPAITGRLDLVAYARKHRYRVRNLHDGGPVPPARWRHPKGHKPATAGHIGEDDRWDAIVGQHGYVAMDGNKLSVCLFYKSAKGVNRVLVRLKAMDARIAQVGDTELGATVPAQRMEEVLKLIRVSKVPLTNPAGHPSSLRRRLPETVLAPESPQ